MNEESSAISTYCVNKVILDFKTDFKLKEKTWKKTLNRLKKLKPIPDVIEIGEGSIIITYELSSEILTCDDRFEYQLCYPYAELIRKYLPKKLKDTPVRWDAVLEL